MAWPGKVDKDELAKEMFGMDAAGVKAQLDKLSALEKTFASQNEVLNKQTELLDNLTKKIGEMKVSAPYDSPPPPQNTPPPNNSPEYREDWGVDADAAFKERFAATSAPLIGGILNTNAAISKKNVREALEAQYHDYSLFAEEIDDLSKTASLQQKVQEDFWRNCYFVVKGRHHDDIMRDQSRKEGKFYLEPAGSSVILRGDENKDPVKDLTDEQKRVAEGLGVPLEIYAKNLQNMGARR